MYNAKKNISNVRMKKSNQRRHQNKWITFFFFGVKEPSSWLDSKTIFNWLQWNDIACYLGIVIAKPHKKWNAWETLELEHNNHLNFFLIYIVPIKFERTFTYLLTHCMLEFTHSWIFVCVTFKLIYRMACIEVEIRLFLSKKYKI